MNHTERWLAGVRPRHNPAENALIDNMRADPNIPWLNSLAAMQHYARQRWPHDPAIQSLIPDYGSGIDAGGDGTVPKTLGSLAPSAPGALS
jgi:hypothetical protein